MSYVDRMILEIHRYLPSRLIPENLLERDFDLMFPLYAKAKYLRELEVNNLQTAIVKALGE